MLGKCPLAGQCGVRDPCVCTFRPGCGPAGQGALPRHVSQVGVRLPGEGGLPASLPPWVSSLHYLESWASLPHLPLFSFSLLAADKHPSPIFLALLPEGGCSRLQEGLGREASSHGLGRRAAGTKPPSPSLAGQPQVTPGAGEGSWALLGLSWGHPAPASLESPSRRGSRMVRGLCMDFLPLASRDWAG